MRKILLAATALMAFSAVAHADPIVGQISFGGPVQYSSANGTTSLDFLGNANVTQLTASGAFSPAFSSGCFGCATFADFSYTGVGAVTPFQLYTATLNGLTTSFVINAITLSNQTADFLNMAATGTLRLTGYDPTPGVFSFSTQPGAQSAVVSFSATSSSVAVPEPASIALFGAGLLGLGLVRRRSNKSA